LADPTTQTFGQLVQNQAAAIQARAAGLVDFSVGAITRAASEAVAGVTLWLQGMILSLLAATRASTSQGSDLDSWIADWGGAPTSTDQVLIARQGATSAVGVVTFSRASATQQAVVPVGATVQSLDGTQNYTVNADTTNPAYNASLGGFVLAAGATSVNVSVTAVTPGAAGNAVAGAVDTIASAIPGLDSVINNAAFTGGQDAETDAAFLKRFQQFLRSLREATPAALAYYLQSLQAGVQCVLVEGQTYAGASQAGFIYFIVDDGTGNPPSTLLSAASVAVNTHRAAGIQYAVYAPSVVSVSVSAVISTISTGAAHTATCNTVAAAITSYLNSLPLQADVYRTKLYQIIHDASADVLEVTSLTLNGATADVVTTLNQVAKASTVTVS
jgi:uncharacterized phage protein gp47/JayE